MQSCKGKVLLLLPNQWRPLQRPSDSQRPVQKWDLPQKESEHLEVDTTSLGDSALSLDCMEPPQSFNFEQVGSDMLYFSKLKYLLS